MPNGDEANQQLAHPATAGADVSRKATATLILVFFFLIFLPLSILGTSIDWPENLSEDAAYNLPLLLDERPSVFWGYFMYLIYSISFYPMAYMMGRLVAGPSNLHSPLLHIGSNFAALSSLSRSIGLSRWLMGMPTLARIYTDPDASEATLAAVSVSYDMLNAWGGGIGEILGVSIFASLWVVCISLLFIGSQDWPSWLGYAGFVVAVDLALNLLEMDILGIDMGANLLISVILLHLWLLMAGLLFLRLPCLNCMQKKAKEPTAE
uniref:DUF4386 domain-containing protein n=1 Tax=Minutocellus polymorphus TaxID=265543 RepID=A0A7S0ALP4_9STRA